MQCLILSAGFGTRLNNITNNIPKALVKVKGIPMLERVINNLKLHGYNDIIINTHYKSNMIYDFIQYKNSFNINISIIHEYPNILGTNGGIKNILPLIKSDNLLVHNVDILSKFDINMMLKNHISNNACITMACSNTIIYNDKNFLLFDDLNNNLKGRCSPTSEIFKYNSNKTNIKSFQFCGIHIINKSFFNILKKSKNEDSIIDIYISNAINNKVTFFNIKDNFWIDIGTFQDYKKANTISDF